MSQTPTAGEDGASGAIQSIARAFSVLEALADAGGTGTVSSVAEGLSLPVPTVHRTLRTLVLLGYARQEPSKTYALGPRLVRLGDSANRLLEAWATPPLQRLAGVIGETASFAVLDGANIVYGAQAPGHHAMQMVTEVGHRAGLHCTAAGKAIVASLAPEDAAKLVDASDMRAYTDRTITTTGALMREVEAIRERGYALEHGEQEIGVSGVAVALPGQPGRGAVMVSGPSARLGDDAIKLAVPHLINTARELTKELVQMAR